MIDLHLHTTASDGRSAPLDLVREAAAAGLSTIAITDHDTLAAIPEACAAATASALECIAGIEITAVHAGRDIHVLGYFLRLDDPDLTVFLDRQRALRRARVNEILGRLDRLGVAVDRSEIDRRAGEPGRAVGRPAIAAALVAAGRARDIADAFDRFLSEGRPAFVPREGASPEEVFDRIARAGGLSSLAHPGKMGRDHSIADWAAAGLRALEVFHPDHSPADQARYQQMASVLDLLMTGGSDYHGPGSGRTAGLGHSVLPRADFDRLRARAAA